MVIHFPVEITIGRLSVPLHAVMETAGFFIGFRYFLYLRKRQTDSIETTNRMMIILGAIFGSLLGSRLIGGLENPEQLLSASNKLLYFYTNKTVVGGFLGGLFGVEAIKKAIGEKQSSGDLFVFPMLLALIIGRIGCFSMGIYEETYGNVTTPPWGMNLGDGMSRHPVSLYEMVFLIALWIGLVQLEKRRKLLSGARFKLFMVAYLLFRLLLDIIKPHYYTVIPFSVIQLTCIAGLLYYYKVLLNPKKQLFYRQ
ncbi:prolipoprotein diacylglyceryltransferase [Filimonas zeae]|uniref:Prolipoprotein diacylglyceryltransferase n=1 Tax=Filimonas zeae TaxID=1737353 RepID=A0A917J3Q2_9BACT|nr:prolipoprotein diacylglyceryl transferase family protein [Filimonas zeae]MDR6342381.1 prolipoprotein diacylglyceryltransferase [Filimonas zeae]GGH81100.1 hypothetical protein GCM10011379_52970 [Filimonas zeae]